MPFGYVGDRGVFKKIKTPHTYAHGDKYTIYFYTLLLSKFKQASYIHINTLAQYQCHHSKQPSHSQP